MTNATSRRFRAGSTWLAGLGLAAGAMLFAGSHLATAQDSDPAVEPELTFTVLQDGRFYTVEVAFYFAEGTSDAEKLDAMEAEIARFESLGASQLSGGGVSAQYVLAGATWPGSTATWYYNPAGKPPLPPHGMPELNAAAATWNGSGSNFRFVTGGTTTASTDGCGTVRDGQNTIGWVDKHGGTLAVTCRWSDDETGRFVEFDMEFDPAWNWTTSQITPDTDFQSVALHEMGHALGLNHPPHSQCPGTVMCATYPQSSIIHDLSGDDVAGAYALYGVAPTPEPPAKVPLPAERGPHRAIAPGAARR